MASEEQKQPQLELIDPKDVLVKLILGENEDCPPCQQIQNFIKQYKGKYRIIDPMDPATEQFWRDDQIELPIVSIEKADGKDVPCEIFMDNENLVLKCEGKLLVIAEPAEDQPAGEKAKDQPQK